MAKVIMRVEGLDGQVELLADRVVIHRAGLWNAMKYGMNARREIPLGAISEVAFKNPTIFTFGEIEFVRGGRSSDERKKAATSSAVKFKKAKQHEFEKLKEKVFEMVNQVSRQR